MTKNLVMQALFRAVATRRPPPGLVHHTDRGAQYCARAYQALVRQFDMKPSMSRRGNCYDNAPIESFWGTLKNELIYQQRFASREQARGAITEYIELFYNRQRTQARLDYLTPAAFTQRFYLKQIAAQPVGVHSFRPTSHRRNEQMPIDTLLFSKQCRQ